MITDIGIGSSSLIAHVPHSAIWIPDPVRDDRLIEGHFLPYAEVFTDPVDRTLATHRRADIIELHPMPSRALPYEGDSGADRPGICIGSDTSHNPPVLESAALEAFIADIWDEAGNAPVAGTYVPLAHFGRTRNVRSVMIEVRRDLSLLRPPGPVRCGNEPVADPPAGPIRMLTRSGTSSDPSSDSEAEHAARRVAQLPRPRTHSAADDPTTTSVSSLICDCGTQAL